MQNHKQGAQNQIFSFSCFDPIGNQGGVSKVIREHMQLFQDAGYRYALLFPVAKVKTKLWGNLINNKFQALISTGDICDQIAKADKTDEIHLHHLMRMRLDEVTKIVDQCKIPVKFFVHDFYCCCPSINFMDSTGKYCGDSAVSEEKCRHCALYESASRHREHMEKFFRMLEDRLTVVAPSQYALSAWLKSFGEIKCHTKVMPLQRAEGAYAGNSGIRKTGEPLRIAYVGSCMSIKGYAQWKTAVAACKIEKKNYQFYVFGDAKEKIDGVINISVNVGKVATDMVDKLRKYEIDVAIINSLCGETYSYTFHECLAANAYIVTNRFSGNVATKVFDNRNGTVLESPDDLTDFLICEETLRSCIMYFKKISSPPDKMVPNTDIVKMVSGTVKTPEEVVCNTKRPEVISPQKILQRLYAKFMTVGYRIARYIKEVSL